jgi:hypothetical protein
MSPDGNWQSDTDKKRGGSTMGPLATKALR